MREVRATLAAHERAVTQREVRDEQVSADERTVTERSGSVNAAELSEADRRDEYAAAVDVWAEGCLTAGVQRLRAVLPTTARDPEEVSAAVAELRRQIAGEEATAREKLTRERAGVQHEQTVLVAERARWESSALVDPGGPSWRSDRTERAGAPLWRLVDVADGTSATAEPVVLTLANLRRWPLPPLPREARI